MNTKPKTYHTIESLMARTEEVGNCIEWQGYFQNKAPYVQHGDRFLAVRRLIKELLGNNESGKLSYGTSCGNRRCVHPNHIVARNTRQHMQFLTSKTNYNNPIRIAKLQKAAQKRRVLTDEQVFMAFSDPRSCSAIAKELNVSKELVAKIRRGDSNKTVIAKNNPFYGLMA